MSEEVGSHHVSGILEGRRFLPLFGLGSLSLAIFLLDLAMSRGFAVGILYLFPLAITLWMARRPSPILLAALFTILSLTASIYSTKGATLTMFAFNRSASIVMLWMIALAIQNRKRIEEELESSRQHLVMLTERLERAQEEERGRIAIEMHDHLGQALTAMAFDLSAIQKLLKSPCGDPKHASSHEKTQSVLEQLRESTNVVQRLAFELRPPMLEDFGLIGAMDWQLEQFTMRTGIAYETDLANGVELDLERGTVLMRVLQEILTNVARHAHATCVKLSLNKAPGHMILVVRDNGIGIDQRVVNNPRSIGLFGMRERLRRFGGHIQISGSKGEGTTVVITLPTN